MKLSVDFDKKYKKSVEEAIKDGRLEKGIADIVEFMNKYDFIAPIRHSAGHPKHVSEDWDNHIFNIVKEERPYVAFISNDEDFIDFLFDKIDKINKEEDSFNFMINVEFTRGAINELIDNDSLIPLIHIEFLPLPHNVGRYEDIFSYIDEVTWYLYGRTIFMRMKEIFKSWLEEYSKKD